jgi:hypothetical protein
MPFVKQSIAEVGAYEASAACDEYAQFNLLKCWRGIQC